MLSLKSNPDGIEIKGSIRQVTLSSATISLGNSKITEPGEYEADGVEVIYSEQAALIVWERLQLVYVFGGKAPTSIERSQFSPCDVLIATKAFEGMEKAVFNELLEVYDPRIVLSQADESSAEAIDVFKISTQSLPEEGRVFIALK